MCGQMSVQPPASRGSVFHPDELWCCFSEGLDWPQINPHVSALEAGYGGGRGWGGFCLAEYADWTIQLLTNLPQIQA